MQSGVAIYRFRYLPGHSGVPVRFELWHEPGRGPGVLVSDYFAYRTSADGESFEFISNSAGDFEGEQSPGSSWLCRGPIQGDVRNGTIIPALGYELPVFTERQLASGDMQGPVRVRSWILDGMHLTCATFGGQLPQVLCLTRLGILGYDSNFVATDGRPMVLESYQSENVAAALLSPVVPSRWTFAAQLFSCSACRSPWWG